MDELERRMRKLEIGKFWEKPDSDFPSSALLEDSLAFSLRFLEAGDARFLNTALKINDTLRSRCGSASPEVLRAEALTGEAFRHLRKRLGLDQ